MGDDPHRKESAPPPRWKLEQLYPSPESKEFGDALKLIESLSKRFARNFTGKIAKLSGEQLADAIESYEKIAALEARVQAYADLVRAVDSSKSAWAVDVGDRVRRASQQVMFFTHEINALHERDLFEKIAAPKLAQYGPWLARTRSFRDHELSPELEKFEQVMRPVAKDAWRRLYDQVMIDMRFSVGGKQLTEGEALNVIDNAASQRKRHEAFAELGRVFGENKKTVALIFNTLADLKAADDRRRNYADIGDSRNIDNQIDRETVDTLVKTVRDNYAKTSHRYYAWKAKKAGVSRLHPADLNAPLPGQKGREYTWDEAKEIVLAAYAKISPEMAAIGKRFFDEGWIDAEPRAGKDSGGFCMPVTPDAHPFILMNFYGAAADVMTLAHELGHGIHQVLAAEQGFLKSETPLTLAETASVFGEMLTFRELMDRETDPVARRNMMAQKAEDMLNTVARQTALFTFERRMHEERREKGELSPERLSELWTETQKESLGPSVNLDAEGAENLWMRISHFVHTPFYVYAYPFGECMVNALWDAYESAADKQDFAKKYVGLLKAGGSKRHETALAPFGLDINDAGFWKKGLAVIEKHLDDLFALDAQLDAAADKAKTEFRDAADKKPANDDAPAPAQPKKAGKGPQP